MEHFPGDSGTDRARPSSTAGKPSPLKPLRSHHSSKPRAPYTGRLYAHRKPEHVSNVQSGKPQSGGQSRQGPQCPISWQQGHSLPLPLWVRTQWALDVPVLQLRTGNRGILRLPLHGGRGHRGPHAMPCVPGPHPRHLGRARSEHQYTHQADSAHPGTAKDATAGGRPGARTAGTRERTNAAHPIDPARPRGTPQSGKATQR